MSEPSHSSGAPACAQTPSPLTLFFCGGGGGGGAGGGRRGLCAGYWSPSLRTTNAFPVVTSLPPKSSYFSEGEKRRPEMRLLFAGYWSPDSQYFNFIFSLLKSLLLGRCSGGTILGSPSHLSSLSPFPSGEPAHGLSSKLFETFNWILMRSGENYFDKKIAKLS